MKRFINFVLILIVVSSPVLSQTTESTASKIDQLFKHAYAKGLFNGTVLVAKKGEVLYKNAFGMAEIATNRKLNVESSFYLASVSKQFTATCIMILKEQGKLEYDDTLEKYFPDFPDYAKSVNIKHMLTHTSGIANHYNLGIYKPGLTNQDVYATLIKQEQLNFVPGSQYEYSNGAYVMLALIVEKVSGMPLHEFMDKHIFKPLDMSRSLVYYEGTPEIENRAVGYTETGTLNDYEILTTGAGGLFSTVEDILKWDMALYTDALVSQATLEEAFTPITLSTGEVSNYGYGWGIIENKGKKSVLHTGSLSGYRTVFRRNLYNKSGYVMLTNFSGRSDLLAIRAALDNILSGQPYDLPKTPIANVLRDQIASSSSKELIKKAKDLLETRSDDYVMDEMRINGLGYSLLHSNDIDNALKVFEVNVALHPESSNVYDSLGEAQLVEGDSTNAIANYKRSYKLNRNNTNAIDVLNNIGVDTSQLTKDVKVSSSTLKSYEGVYALSPNMSFNITFSDGQLYIQPTGQNRSPIYPSSKTRFYSKLVDAQITFNKDDNGKIVSLTLHQNGDHQAKRLE